MGGTAPWSRAVLISRSWLPAVVLGLVLSSGPALATDYYVDGFYGSHSNSGLDWGHAFRYLNDVNSLVRAGSTVYIRNLNGVAADSVSNNNVNPTHSGTPDQRITYVGKVGFSGNYDWKFDPATILCDTSAYTCGWLDLNQSYITVKGLWFRGITNGETVGGAVSVAGSPRGIGDSLVWCRADSGFAIQGAVGSVVAHNWIRNKFFVLGSGFQTQCDSWVNFSTCSHQTFQANLNDTIRDNRIQAYCTQENAVAFVSRGIIWGGRTQGTLTDSNRVSVAHYRVSSNGIYDESTAFIAYSMGDNGPFPNRFQYNHWSTSATQTALNGHPWEWVRFRAGTRNNYFYADTMDIGWDATSYALGAGAFNSFMSATTGDTTGKCVCPHTGGGEGLWEEDNNYWDNCVWHINGTLQFQSDQVHGHINNSLIVSSSDPVVYFSGAFPTHFDFHGNTIVGPNRMLSLGGNGFKPVFNFQQNIFFSTNLSTFQFAWDSGSFTWDPGMVFYNNLCFNNNGAPQPTAVFSGQYTGLRLDQMVGPSGGNVGLSCAFQDPYFLNRSLTTFNPTYRLQGSGAANNLSFLACPDKGFLPQTQCCGDIGRRPPCFLGAIVPSDSIRPAFPAISVALSSNLDPANPDGLPHFLKDIQFTETADDSLVFPADSVFICELPCDLPPADTHLSQANWRDNIIWAYRATYNTMNNLQDFNEYLDGTRKPSLNGGAGSGGSDVIFGPSAGLYGIGNVAIVVKDWAGNISAISDTYEYYTP